MMNRVLACVVMGGVVAACGEAAMAQSDALPPKLFVDAAPANAKNIKDAKPTVKKGDKVTLRGRIGGSKDPFVSNRAIFTIVDQSLIACNEKEDDHCKYPWDYCCETKSAITAASATVQVADPASKSGMPLKLSARGKGGLEPLSTVLVEGTVANTDNKAVLVVNASSIYVERLGEAKFVSAAIEGSRSVSTVRAGAKKGDEVVIRARIGGAAAPFNPKSSIFTIADAELPTCDKGGKPDCKTPWDLCSVQTLVPSTATVRIVGFDHKPYAASVEGVAGLRPGAIVTIAGVVATTDESEFVVEPKRIAVER